MAVLETKKPKLRVTMKPVKPVKPRKYRKGKYEA